MREIYPYFTNDSSVGLYSPEDNDIYHSTYGALTEAYEKFIYPANLEEFFINNSEIKILDICFGIGYNTKSFLNFLYSAQIYTNNNTTNNNYIDKIYTDNYNTIKNLHEAIKNKKIKIFIKAIDTDKILAGISPFIICNKNNLPDNYTLPFQNEKIQKLLNKPIKNKIKFYEEINLILMTKIQENYPEIINNSEIFKILRSKKYNEYFAKNYALIKAFYYSIGYIITPLERLNMFLHNIYYQYVSTSYKKALKWLRFNDFTFELKIDDARNELLNDNNLYNFIFLDAFTPAKCPCLWTIDFFKLLYKHLANDGMVLTYSNSASIRNALINAGFFVGKIYTPSSNKFMGTVAVKNKSLIKNELSEYDLSLIKTKAGIFYRDENLDALNDEIIIRHNNDIKNSDLISSSKFIKEYRKQHVKL